MAALLIDWALQPLGIVATMLLVASGALLVGSALRTLGARTPRVGVSRAPASGDRSSTLREPVLARILVPLATLLLRIAASPTPANALLARLETTRTGPSSCAPEADAPLPVVVPSGGLDA